MSKSMSVALFLIVMSGSFAAHGQRTNGSAVPRPPGDAAGQPQNSDHLAPTGKTVPNPGVSQASGTTELDRKIKKQDEKTQDSICKGC
jgi:hypothetical protein